MSISVEVAEALHYVETGFAGACVGVRERGELPAATLSRCEALALVEGAGLRDGRSTVKLTELGKLALDISTRMAAQRRKDQV